MTSSLSSTASSTTSNEIVPIEENPNHNPTQIAISGDINNKEIEKPPTDVVIDHPEANKLCSMLTSLHPCNFWHKNSQPKSNNNKPITNIEARSNDDDNNSNYRKPNKAEDLCKLIGANVNSLEKASERMRKYEGQIKEVLDKFNILAIGGGSEDEFRELKREVMKLKQQISSNHEDGPQESESTADIDRVNADSTVKYPAFERMFDSKEFRARYDQKNMSIKMTSPLSSTTSLATTSNEIVPIEENPSHNPTQIAISDDINNKEIEKSPTDVVIDHPEANKLCSLLTSLHPCNFWHKNSKPKSNDNKPITNIEPRSNDDDNNRNYSRPNKAEDLCKLIGANVNPLEKASKRMRKYEDQIKEVSEKFENLKKGGGSEDEFGELKREVMKLKQQISSKHEDEPQESESTADIDRVNVDNTLKYPAFERMFDSKEFRARYDQLDSLSKNCLLCFSVFPENAEINKRVMIYWWIGEGFATTEQIANDLFINLFVERFIEPVCKMGSFAVNIWKMDPLVRSLVIEIAKTSSFFDFDHDDDDDDGSVTSRECLIADGLTKIQDFEKLNTLFNVNESILEFNPEFFSKMKKLSVLYLGRWQTSVSHHIEAADTKSMKINGNVLDGLENITNLTFLSLHGISRITELPESISRLTDLTILDIRACHNLEVIPNGIGLLKSLTHLDMSECYLLDQMPKGLASLYNLQVLKGFIVSESKNSCTLDDLRKFPKLRKLSIYAVVYGFPSDRDLRALNQFKALTNLTITWTRGSLSEQANSDDSEKKDILGAKQATLAAAKKPGLTKALTRSFTSKPAGLPSGLIKLDLQCFPQTSTPTWLMACNLKNLKKLYIRGGKLSVLGQFQKLDGKKAEKDKWEVEILRLKYLNDLEMDWSNLQELFPKLNYLEMVKCPKLTCFPCDESGVWMDSNPEIVFGSWISLAFYFPKKIPK